MTIAEIVLFAIGLLGASMFILGVLHIPFAVSITLAVIGIVAACWRWSAAVRRRGVVGEGGLPLLIITVIPLLAIAFTAAIVPLNDFDGRVFWLLKAKALATERTIDGPFFHWSEPRNQYPLLMPLDASVVMMATGNADDRGARWLYVVAFAALVFFIRQRLGPWYAAILAWLPQFAVASEGGALSGYSDIAFAAFVACAFFELLDARAPLRFGVWLSFLVLAKSEGLPVAAILLAIAVASFRRRIIVSAIPPMIAAAALFFWRSGITRTDEENYLALLRDLPSHFGRLLPAVAESAKYLFALRNWGLLWIAVLIALGVLLWRREWRAPAAVAAMASLYIGAYVVTQWTMRDLIAASADRLLMHMIGPALYGIDRALRVSLPPSVATPSPLIRPSGTFSPPSGEKDLESSSSADPSPRRAGRRI